MTRYNIRPEPKSPTTYTVQLDNSLPLLYDTRCRQNPDRGFRGELYLTLGSGKSYPSWETSADMELEKELRLFQPEGIQVYQLYVYLIEFYNRPLSTEALAQLTAYLKKLHANGKRVLLRFAYEYDSCKKGPKAKQVLAHLEQLRGWFQEHAQLADDTIYALQLGIFGLWGEGHGMRCRSMRSEKNKRAILRAFFDSTPATMTVMMRTPDYLTLVAEQDRLRASIHDDYLIGREDAWGMIPFDHPDNQALYQMSQHSITDAEMPWGTNNKNAPIDPFQLLVQVKNYGLCTLSAKHNYKEEKDGIAGFYYLEEWKKVMLSPAALERLGLPRCPAVFGEAGTVSVFDYLAAHLGYLLAVSNLKRAGDHLCFDLINFGMGAPHDFAAEVKIGDAVQPLPLDWKQLGQFCHQTIRLECPAGAPLALRLFHRRSRSLTIRLANDIPFTPEGWNCIYENANDIK